MNSVKGITIAIALLSSVYISADNETPQDTIKTYNLDEVVVSSSIRETNKFRTMPAAVSVISPQSINNRQIDALKDLSSFVPNLYIPDYGSKMTSAIYLRGIGARSSGQSIGLYVDNAPYLDKSTFDFELMDIQRIEVLRGPQGTLYGRNAMGGIVNIYTLNPFDYQGTKLSVSGGNHGQFRAKASHYMKASDKIGLSLSGYYNRNDGFFTNIYNGKKADKEETAGGRFKLDWHFNPKLALTYSLSYDYVNQGAFPYGQYDRETGVIAPVNINDSCHYRRDVLTNNLSLTYQTGQFIFSSTTGYQYFKDDMLMDQDYSPKSIFTLNQKQKQHAVSQEFAIKSNTQRNYQWSFGLYGFYNDLHTDGPVTFKEDGVKEVLQPVFDKLSETINMPFPLTITDERIYIPGTFDTPSYGAALYHQSTYNNLFTKGLSLTAGIRLDYEKQEMDYASTAKMNMGIRMGGNVIPIETMVPIPQTVIDEHISQDFWQVLPKVSLKYECTPRTFTYITVAKGYKAGGYNVQMSADLAQSQMQYDMMKAVDDVMGVISDEAMANATPKPIDEVTSYKPEKSWNYELGIRSELVKDRLSGELTFFYMDVRDMQLTRFVESGNGRYLTNAGKARSLGVEASLRANITKELTADLNYGFTNAKFRDYIYEAKNTEGELIKTDCDGNYIPYVPKHTLNIGLTYNKQLRNCWIDQFIASAQLSGTGNIYWTELNDISQKFYAQLNAKAGVRKGIVRIDVFSRNITDTQYAAFYFESRNQPFIQKGKPFQIGAEVSVTF